MAKTKVLTAPYDKDGSLLHHPADGEGFSHYEDEQGNRLTYEDIYETIPASIDEHGRYSTRQRRDDWHRVYNQVGWRPNEPFHATLEIKHMLRGRSAKYPILGPANAPDDKRTFPMFVADLVDAACTGTIQAGGIISGRWMVSKRGANYGLRLAKEEE